MSTIIIAEAGVNHNGSLKIAKELIDVAASAGADFVKFQTFNTEKLVGKNVRKANYQKENFADEDDSQYSMLKKLELTKSMHYELITHCSSAGIKFLSTAFDIDSIDFLDQLNIELFKIPSGEITNKPYLQRIAEKGKTVILSTGMANLKEIKDAMDVLTSGGLRKEHISLLHCSTEYPAAFKDVNLKAMLTMQKELGVKVGYSDHTPGIEVAVAAVAMGAQIIEKHFKVDTDMDCVDAPVSITEAQMRKLVSEIRRLEKCFGKGGLGLRNAEKGTEIFRRFTR